MFTRCQVQRFSEVDVIFNGSVVVGGRRVIASQPGLVPLVRDEIMQVLIQHDYGDRELFAVRMCLEEAIMNAIKHGNREHPAKFVRITFVVDQSQVWIQIADEGDGFAVEAVPDPTLPENLDRSHGRGVWLMQRYMDHVDYNDRGNCVALLKLRDGGHQAT